MYIPHPGGVVEAVDASTGDLIWQYRRPPPAEARAASGITRNIAIYSDRIYYAAPGLTAPSSRSMPQPVKSCGRRRSTTTNATAPATLPGPSWSAGRCSRDAPASPAASPADVSSRHMTPRPGRSSGGVSRSRGPASRAGTAGGDWPSRTAGMSPRGCPGPTTPNWTWSYWGNWRPGEPYAGISPRLGRDGGPPLLEFDARARPRHRSDRPGTTSTCRATRSTWTTPTSGSWWTSHTSRRQSSSGSTRMPGERPEGHSGPRERAARNSYWTARLGNTSGRGPSCTRTSSPPSVRREGSSGTPNSRTGNSET